MRKTLRSSLSFILSAAFVFSSAAAVSASVMTPAPEFDMRTETPVQEETSADYKYYYGPENPYNTFDNCEMPNCTTYAFGRIFEIHGTKPELSRNNAAKWYGENIEDGSYSYGCEPKKGAVKCIEKIAGTWGHVSVIEEVYEDGTVFVSESQNKGAMFTTYTEMSDNNAGYRLLGFIYPDEPEAKFYGDGFRISSAEGGTYLTRSEDGISLEERNKNKVAQNFRFEPLENGNYRIYSYSTGLVLARDGSSVVLSDDDESEVSEWKILTEINDLWTICAPYDTNRVLTFSDGNAFVSEYTASEDQFWNLERFSGKAELNTEERNIVFSLDCTEARTEYYTDEFLDLAGIRFFLNGREIKNVDTSKLTADYDFTEAGEMTVTVVYGFSSISFDVTVTEPEDGMEVIRNSELRTNIISYISDSEGISFSEEYDVNHDGSVNAADVLQSEA